MELLKGADVIRTMKSAMKEETAAMERPPVLAIVRVGGRPDDLAYERGAVKRMRELGIRTVCRVYPGDISDEAFREEFSRINGNPEYDGILLLRPLPEQIDEGNIVRTIDPDRDVDGISPMNMAKLFINDPTGFAPCTAEAVVEMLRYTGMRLEGKRAVIIGRSLVIGKPLAQLLMRENCTVTVCHSRTKDLPEVCREGEILVAALGKARLIDGSYVAPGATVIDVGIHVLAGGTLCGDVALETLPEETAYATPVPGGVGSVTTFVLAKHVIRAAKRRQKGSGGEE